MVDVPVGTVELVEVDRPRADGIDVVVVLLVGERVGERVVRGLEAAVLDGPGAPSDRRRCMVRPERPPPPAPLVRLP